MYLHSNVSQCRLAYRRSSSTLLISTYRKTNHRKATHRTDNFNYNTHAQHFITKIFEQDETSDVNQKTTRNCKSITRLLSSNSLCSQSKRTSTLVHLTTLRMHSWDHALWCPLYRMSYIHHLIYTIQDHHQQMMQSHGSTVHMAFVGNLWCLPLWLRCEYAIGIHTYDAFVSKTVTMNVSAASIVESLAYDRNDSKLD